MYTRYYDSYPVETEQKAETETGPKNPPVECSPVESTPSTQIASVPKKLLGGFDYEDILLIALLFITVTESKDDFILPLILGALLLE